MKFLSALALFSTVTLLAAEKPKPANIADAIAPTTLEGRSSKHQRLITSELNGRELHFISSALEVRNTLVYLGKRSSEAKNPTLRNLGIEIQENLPAQTAVLTTLAEMRSVTIPEESSRQQAIAKRIANMKGARFEKALLDALLDANHQLVATCEVGLRSTDKSVRQFAEQTLPYAQGTLARVQMMAGIAPRRAKETAAAPKTEIREPSAQKPGFRTNIPPVGSNE